MNSAAMLQERLLAEYRAPANRRELVAATARAERKNVTCGDAMRVMVRVADGVVGEVTFLAEGCSIVTASASLMTRSVTALTVGDARMMVGTIEAMLRGDTALWLPSMLEPLRAVAAFQGRHGCVLMPWLALRDALA